MRRHRASNHRFHQFEIGGIKQIHIIVRQSDSQSFSDLVARGSTHIVPNVVQFRSQIHD